MVATATTSEALAAAADALAAAGVDSPRLDAELLLAEASGRDRAALVAGSAEEVGPAVARSFGAMVRRRVGREPVAYILGRKGFRRIELGVDPRVLIPRPETELLVEIARELRPANAIDVGTGSGAVALALADEIGECEIVATDISRAALTVAEANAERLRLADRVRFELGTLPATGAAVDVLLANLPYVTSAEMGGLAPEITRFEPRSALVGGEDGLVAIRSLLAALGSLDPGSRPAAVALEVGEGQAASVIELVRAAGYERAEARRDMAGIERAVVGEGAGE